MNKIAQYRNIEKSASFFNWKHLSIILDQTVGPGVTEETTLKLFSPSVFNKTAYIRSAENISVPEHSAKGALKGGVLFTPYGAQSAWGAASRGLKGKRKAFAIPVITGMGLGAISEGLMAKSDKDLIKARGRNVLREVNIRDKEQAAASRGATRGLIKGVVAGTGVGAITGKLLGSKFKKLKGVGSVAGAIWGGSTAGLAGAEIGKHRAKRKFQLENWNKY